SAGRQHACERQCGNPAGEPGVHRNSVAHRPCAVRGVALVSRAIDRPRSTTMQLAMVGLGRMGANLVRRLMGAGHECVVFDRDGVAVDKLAREGASPAGSLPDLVSRLRAPRAVWVMLPHGAATESTLAELAPLLSAGDAVIDGGNGHHHDDVRRAAELAQRSIDYLDIGTSGGVWGLERGYCLMIGGPAASVQRLAPLFDALA